MKASWMKMSWIDVVGMNRVVAVEKYDEDDVEVCIPKPRNIRRDSSGDILRQLRSNVEAEWNIDNS